MRVGVGSARALFVVAAAAAVAACGREPSEADLLRALQRYHAAWAAEQRQHGMARRTPVFVNLAFDATLNLHIHAVRKERCRPATEAMGYICTVEVEATTPYQSGVRRRVEARFVEGTKGWLAVKPRPLDTSVRQGPDAGNPG